MKESSKNRSKIAEEEKNEKGAAMLKIRYEKRLVRTDKDVRL